MNQSLPLNSGETLIINGYEYRLESKLAVGVGSYGEVWAATDLQNQQSVALKFIHAENRAQAGETAGQQWQKHLQREIGFLSRLTEEQTRHIVKLLNHGEVNGQPVLVLERLQANLNHWVHNQPKPLPLRQVLEWAQQILAGLAIVHAHGLVYRDLKFSNVLVNDDGQRLKLADFGTVKAQRDDRSQFSFAGTPTTMAPEQRLPVRFEEGKPFYAVDQRSDFYALGLMLFRLLTDQPTIAYQELIEEALNKRGYEGVVQNPPELGGLNQEEEKRLHDAIWTGWGLDEATVGPGQHHRLQQAQALYDLILQLLAPRKEGRPGSAEAIDKVLNAALAAVPDPAPAVAASQIPPPSLDIPKAVLPPVEPPPLSVRQSMPNQPPTMPHQRRRIYGLIALVGVAAMAGGIVYWWPGTDPLLVDTAPPLTDEPTAPKPTEAETPPLPSTPVPIPESAPTTPTSTPPPVEAVNPTEPVLTPVIPPTAPIAEEPSPPAPVAEPSPPAKPTPVTPAEATEPEPVAVVETPTTENTPAQPTPSQPIPQRQDQLEVTPPAPTWRKLERDPLAVGGFAPELVVVPTGNLEFTDRTSQARQMKMSEFALAMQPVTRADYAVFARNTGRSLPFVSGSTGETDATQPVTAITWYEAQAYVEWLSEQTGQRYRLPSELEWLYSQKQGVDDGLNSAWTGFVWTAGCDFGDCRRDQQMVWLKNKRQPQSADQGGRDIGFRVVREGSGR